MDARWPPGSIRKVSKKHIDIATHCVDLPPLEYLMGSMWTEMS
jgi:hypothetical protein